MTLAIARGNPPGVEVRGIVDTFDRARRPATRLGQPYVPGKPIEYGGTEIQNRKGLLATNRKSFEKIQPVIASLAKKAGLLPE